MRQRIEPASGWETGRASEPAMMDLNLHATRDDFVNPGVQPKVVVWQHDADAPLNPRGFLVAYEEACYLPAPAARRFSTHFCGRPLPLAADGLVIAGACWCLQSLVVLTVFSLMIGL
jgi:hypothetical protein